MTTLDGAGEPVDPQELARLIVARHIGDVPELAAEADLHAHLKQGGAWVLDVPDRPSAVWGSGDEVLWASGEALMVCGGQGSGKTTLAHQLIRARLGLDNSLLGFPVQPGNRRVLYLGMDRPQQAARAMRRIMGETDRRILDAHLRVWPGPPPADVGKHPNTLVDLATEADADTIVVDSLKDAAVGLVDDVVGATYNRARQQALAAGIEILELHHNRKTGSSGGTPDSISDIYGSTWLTSGAGSVLMLSSEPGDAIVEARHLKQPAADCGPLRIVHDHASGRSSLDDPVDLVELAERCDGITAADAACRLFESATPTRNQTEKARRKLDRLVETGALRRTGGGRGRGKQAAYLPVVAASGWETDA
ncbi:AAA family ATPase [Stackebrandtia nassauensis]|uniref:AAA ATPase n=1 Tax=Stackebrandtia nassauensis (strain DSM 44728 / CIP 108903 / NRRL B-16338 / NBRC 102104 / LLR-40K-21) TaxID=446470 RepID=D3Q2C9_STANL|nr:AAA family ATPase [Stackebrandtia nassauensis]ADD43862.1 AAA ATPase [Stackebrandtia nassauensis DSM 44728]